MPEGLDEAVVQLVRVLRGLGRDDLENRATAAGARLKRPATIVCVVGEFKQGKSSLVNGLLGQQICPVDDDLATSALTLVRHGDVPQVTVRRRDDRGATVAEKVTIEDLRGWVSEQGNPGNHKQVQRVEIAVASAVLRQGLVLVDSPGMGGLGAGHAAATLSFLPFADGLVLVSDASAELSAPEVEFLRRATELCPTVLFALTKIDLYPEWRRILNLNRAHLAVRGVDIPIVAVSSALRLEALARRDRDLNEASRFPELIRMLADDVVTPAKEHAAERSAADVRSIAALVRTGLEEERALLADPSRMKHSLAQLEEANTRLEHLRGPGARWSVLVGDRVADLSNEVNFRFRGGIRTVQRTLDEQVEEMKTPTEWDEMARTLQTLVADHVTQAFAAVEKGRTAIREEVAGLLQVEYLNMPSPRGSSPSFDAAELWRDKDLVSEKAGRRALQTGLTGVRGAQSGVMMFGMMGGFLPAAAATLIASNPVLLGAGAVFGGLQLAEDRKRKVAQLRQTARQQVRQFVDDVQFEVGNAIGELVRQLQRDLRDEFTDRLAELQRTYAETARRAQDDAKRTQDEVQRRLAETDEALVSLTRISQLAGGGPA
ncbi:MAG: Dynamin family [uncultured Acidimicrobiales bacterium]|uniref:Dynamin family n=1 Tax=uncultured Acidimicrobiales bacterium TaxID=310071 RepID=A0A6J4JF79_9ACTN|nr:MAG: Dynamin family [uncultured Acidimicrobiales bacterium]